MHHFSTVGDAEASELFHRPPQPLTIDSPPSLLAAALGGTLYCPGDRRSIAADVLKQASRGCVSMVLCLEDSIADSAVAFAETNVAAALLQLHETSVAESDATDGLPLLFIRVRSPEQMLKMAGLVGPAIELLSGFVVPKFDNHDGDAQRFFDALHLLHREYQQGGSDGRRRLRVMPILESPVLVHAETRAGALTQIADVVRANRDDVLALRIGGTDLASAFGLRRSRDFTVYDVSVVSSVIGDIVNVLGRPDDNFVISGPVWEHYNTERILRPQLRLTPFVDANENELRQRLMLAGLDGLIREISLDHANGLLGKTVIHPSHVPVVNALSVVSHEEYLDATAILGDVGGGASASPYRNKMNEMKPHHTWAKKTLLRADAFGVASETTTFVDLLEAGMR